ncbi:hypothetical protein EU523_00580, partial [Candidatus Heimdallarchaeota archaeon]
MTDDENKLSLETTDYLSEKISNSSPSVTSKTLLDKQTESKTNIDQLSISENELADNVKTSSAMEPIESQLWELATKYKHLFENGKILQIIESETDRKKVSSIYKIITNLRQQKLDARVYHSFIKMQRTRDIQIALEGLLE